MNEPPDKAAPTPAHTNPRQKVEKSRSLAKARSRETSQHRFPHNERRRTENRGFSKSDIDAVRNAPNAGLHNALCWQDGTSFAIGEEVLRDFNIFNTHVFPRSV